MATENKKMITIRFNRMEFGKKFQKWLLSCGFTWSDGLTKYRDCGENEYYLEINVNNATFKKIPFFSPPESFIDIKPMEVENEFDWHPVMKRLRDIFKKYGKPERLREVPQPAAKDKPNVKYNTYVKQKGIAVQNYGRPMDNINDF